MELTSISVVVLVFRTESNSTVVPFVLVLSAAEHTAAPLSSTLVSLDLHFEPDVNAPDREI